MPVVVGKDESVYKRLTCRNCGSINQYAPNEVRILREDHDYSGGGDGAKGFWCAGCGAELIVRLGDVD